MVLLYQPKKQKKLRAAFTTIVQDLDYQGLGVAKIQGKTWFIENALPQEQVQVQVIEEKRQYGLGRVQKILQASPLRQTPRCAYYQICGGCQSQHIPIHLQRETKQKALFQRLTKLQKEAIEFMPMISGEAWHYRRRVRLSLYWDAKSKKLKIGFRQKNSQQIVNIRQCDVLDPLLNELLPKLHELLSTCSKPKTLGHIELVAADNGVAMLLRVTEKLAEHDRTLLLDFAFNHQVMLFVQDEKEICHLQGDLPYYQLDDGSILHFDIRDFIQVNRQLNQNMVNTALDWLDLKKKDNVLDLFCGMGNFTLPISRYVKSAVGIEGVLPMVEKARRNGERNHCHNVQFYQCDLSQSFTEQEWAKVPFDKILLDPPRSGAAFALNALCYLMAEKILYVSCNPATLVRDVELLLKFGYQLKKVAMIDMFPHTSHLESISLFERNR